MTIAVLILTILASISYTQANDYQPQGPSCIKLYIALRHFIRVMDSGGEDSPGEIFASMTGVDPSDDMVVKKFACQIAEVNSLEEAEVLMESEEVSGGVLQGLYGKLMGFIEDQGGMEVISHAYLVITHIMEGGELLDLNDENFETLPINVDPDILNYLFENLVKEFGVEFIQMFFSNTVPFSEVPFLVAAITESKSIEEAAKALEIEPDQLERFLANFGNMVTQQFLPLSLVKAAYFLLVTASEYGLLSLPF